MTSNREIQSAIAIVAEMAVARLILEADSQWENYPEIGEDDWREVEHQMLLRSASAPSDADFNRAYEFLTARADPGGTQ
jgi:hypothetical protein